MKWFINEFRDNLNTVYDETCKIGCELEAVLDKYALEVSNVKKYSGITMGPLKILSLGLGAKTPNPGDWFKLS